MHIVELYACARRLALAAGYDVREENLNGAGGGACTVAGRKCLYVDNALPVAEQIDQVLHAIDGDPQLKNATIPRELADIWPQRRMAA